jgi:hypothetical protein
MKKKCRHARHRCEEDRLADDKDRAKQEENILSEKKLRGTESIKK